jgi:hypothetical protein
MTCSRYCGKIKVPFPFGLEDGCSAREELTLYCQDASTLMTLYQDHMRITNINTNEGFLDAVQDRDDVFYLYDPLYINSGYSRRLQWVVANITCQEAHQNISTYACVSPNSKCLAINSIDGHSAGYRCKCKDGYDGNPYITGPDGCHGMPTFPIYFSLTLVRLIICSCALSHHLSYISSL